MRPHCQRYPDQYRHALCGKRVRVNIGEPVEGVVTRVVAAYHFGFLVHLRGITPAYSMKDCEVIPHVKQHIVMPDDPESPNVVILTTAQAEHFASDETGIIRKVSETDEQALYELPDMAFEEFEEMVARPPYNTL